MSTPLLDQLREGPPTIPVPPACELLGISRSHGYTMIKAGQFPVRTIKVGGSVRVIRAALLEFLEGKLGAA